MNRALSIAVSASPTRNGNARQKRWGQQVTQASAEKRPRPMGLHDARSAVEGVAETSGGFSSSAGVVGSSSSGGTVPDISRSEEHPANLLSEVPEEDRQRRLQKRSTGVAAVRNSPDYQFLKRLWESGRGIVGPPPPTHDPADESVN